MKLLLIDYSAGKLTCYVGRRVTERFEITDRQEFDRWFTCDVAERLRTHGDASVKEKHI